MAGTYLADVISGGPTLGTGAICLLVAAIGMALAFEFVNGFHDTANAVATVIYTNALKPWQAVVWSGCFNLIGVLCSNGGVAYTVLKLLPAEMVTHVSSTAGFVMIFSILISAILWNLGTWYMGLPASSSHTLLGAIVGVGLANSMMTPGHAFGDGVNWPKVREAFSALLISPVVGFVGAGALILIGRRLIPWKQVFQTAEAGKVPPPAVRGTLIGTCTAVSYFHGSNDGQKGMGLILLILIGVLPGAYAMNLHMPAEQVHKIRESATTVDRGLAGGKAAAFDPAKADAELTGYLKNKKSFDPATIPALGAIAHDVSETFGKSPSVADLPLADRERLRSELYLSSASIDKLINEKRLSGPQLDLLNGYKSNCLDPATHNIPRWVMWATATALGLGTMIGWKRIVVTVGEKIGKQHLSYAQGASAEIMAALTIAAADFYKMPVSTTHVLSSGIAGTMAADGSGVQFKTLRNILVAWVLTLPVCVLLGAGLFAGGLVIAANNLMPLTLGFVAVIGVGLVVWRLRRIPAGRDILDPQPG